MNKDNTALLASVFAKAEVEKKMTRGNAGIVIYARDIKRFYMCKRGDDLGWCSPAGHPDKNDKDGKATAIRECAEESGYVFAEDEVKFIGNILCFAKGRYHESAIFAAELNSEAARSRRSSNTDGEMTAWQWVSVEEMLEMDVFAPTLIAINLFLEKCEL